MELKDVVIGQYYTLVDTNLYVSLSKVRVIDIKPDKRVVYRHYADHNEFHTDASKLEPMRVGAGSLESFKVGQRVEVVYVNYYCDGADARRERMSTALHEFKPRGDRTRPIGHVHEINPGNPRPIKVKFSNGDIRSFFTGELSITADQPVSIDAPTNINVIIPNTELDKAQAMLKEHAKLLAKADSEIGTLRLRENNLSDLLDKANTRLNVATAEIKSLNSKLDLAEDAIKLSGITNERLRKELATARINIKDVEATKDKEISELKAEITKLVSKIKELEF